MKQLTQDEFFEKYGDVDVVFTGYHAGVFRYIGELSSNVVIVVSYKCQSFSNMLEYVVFTGRKEKVRQIKPNIAIIYERDGEIESFIDLSLSADTFSTIIANK